MNPLAANIRVLERDASLFRWVEALTSLSCSRASSNSTHVREPSSSCALDLFLPLIRHTQLKIATHLSFFLSLLFFSFKLYLYGPYDSPRRNILYGPVHDMQVSALANEPWACQCYMRGGCRPAGKMICDFLMKWRCIGFFNNVNIIEIFSHFIFQHAYIRCVLP